MSRDLRLKQYNVARFKTLTGQCHEIRDTNSTMSRDLKHVEYSTVSRDF